MKKKNIITRWSIIGGFFILSVMSSFYLVKSYRNTPDSISRITTNINKEIQSLDSHIRKEGKRATYLDSLFRNGCCKDPVKINAEILVIKNLTMALTNVEGSLKKSLVSLKKQEKKISSAQKSLTNSEQKESKASTYTWIFSILTCILVTAFFVSVILFSGVLRLFNKNKNKNKNKNMKDNDVNSTVSQNNNSNTENDKTESSNSEVTTGATNITTEEKDGSDTKNLSEETKKRIRVFTNNQKTLGISFQGDNHLKATPAVPCQDCHSFTKINENWSVAIVSDGAGSKEHSDMGSNAVCAAFTHYLTHILTKDKRFVNGDIPNEKIWDLEFRALLNTFQSQLKSIKPFNTFDFESLAATIIILAYSPKGYLFAHVGDGRAGVKVNGEWKTILTPHKGEEANQTIFSTTIEFNKKPTLMMSGVFVPETKVEEASIEAFVLMSDGCEDGAWTTYQRVNLPDGDFRVEDVNQPRAQTLEQLMSIIDAPEAEQQAKLIDFITGYNKGFKTEGDDKTILFEKIK